MATARELLEQADALMRRNRALIDDIPLLTEIVEAEEAKVAVPTLTDALKNEQPIEYVLESEATPAYEVEELSTLPEEIRSPDILTEQTTVPPVANETIPLSEHRENVIAKSDIHETQQALSAAETVEPEQEEPRYLEIAEQVYAQVLQNLDLYTEKALQQHLAVHLQPIVEKVGKEVLTAVNAQVGQLLREFIAQAIEKEIDRMKEES